MINKKNTTRLVKIAVFSVVAFLISYIKIPLFLQFSFLKLDFSDAIVLIGGFSLGPVAALVIEFTKVLLSLVFKGTFTLGLGQLADFLFGCSFVLPASFIYRKKRTFKGAIVAMIAATLSLTFFSAALNYFLFFPLYLRVFNLQTKYFNEYFLLLNFFFNFFKGTSLSFVSVFVYKRFSSIINKINV